MPATRRNGAVKSPIVEPTASSRLGSTTQPTASPAFPAWLLLYPATLLLGSLFSILDPAARGAPYSAVLQSHPPEVAPSYFAQKKNIVNLYFVKVGWFWITSAYLSFIYARSYRSLPRKSRSDSGAEVVRDWEAKERIQGVLRWAAATLWWTFVTQWFFGPPLIDRGFKWTGGKCDVLLEEGAKDTADLVTAAACKLAGGAWIGGHDISGHVFLLVLGSAFLGMEALPVVFARLQGEVADTEAEDSSESWSLWYVGAVGATSWWMILMTAIYFHTWFEKLTGLLVAFIAISSVYLLPNVVPQLHSILGTPSS